MTSMFDPRRVGRDLDRARRTHGGRNWPASFADRLTAPVPGAREVARMVRERAQAHVDASVRVPAVAVTELPNVDPPQAAATWIGHASFVLRIGGRTILTDPVWSTRIPGVRARLAPPAVPLAAVGRIDAVLISHNHYDHLDAATIRRIPRHTAMFVPGMLGSWFRRRNFTNVIEMDWWETAELIGSPATVSFVPAHHWSRRGLGDTCKTLWGGFVVRAGDRSVYFAGDTGYGHWFAEIGDRFPGVDLALLPVGAYEPNWFMKPVHMNPEEAVRACLDVGARQMATMHWGTFALSAEPILEPPIRAAAAWSAAGRPAADFHGLPVGGTVII
jgi:L-ascorbate metabolism protein UlaG (beta-lactamase superfamily)